MVSSTSITLDLQSPNIAVVAAAKQNDSMSREIVATLKNGSDPFIPPGNALATIRFAKPDRTAGWYDVMEDETTPAYSITGNVITILLCEQMLTVPGNVYVEINFYTQTERLSTFSFLLKVEKSVLSDSEIVSSDYYNVLSQKIDALLGATTHPPQINSTSKNWMLWSEDHNQYEDSGYSSVGTRGPRGYQGTSISSTSKASGTSQPGTTDTYNVNLADGTVAGSFTVYNGMNGTGSVNSVNNTFPDQSGNVELELPMSIYVGPSAPSDPDINVWFDTDDPGQSVVNSVNGASGPVTLDADDVGAMAEWDLLWENVSPTSEFSAQTIALGLSEYDMVAVIFGGEHGNEGFRVALSFIEGAEYLVNFITIIEGTSYFKARTYTPSSTGIQFGNCNQNGTATPNNYQNVPVRIYGIKGVTSGS